jgi:HEAT repeats/PBS lyase HEAT-like repeat
MGLALGLPVELRSACLAPSPATSPAPPRAETTPPPTRVQSSSAHASPALPMAPTPVRVRQNLPVAPSMVPCPACGWKNPASRSGCSNPECPRYGNTETDTRVSRLIDVLEEALAGDRDDSRARTAAETLGELRDRRAIRVLMRAADKETDPAHPRRTGMRIAAAEALARIGGPEPLDLFVSLLTDGDRYVRRTAASFLIGSEDPRAGEWRDIAPVIAEISSETAEVCAEAARKAGEIRDPKAVDALSQALRSWRGRGPGPEEWIVSSEPVDSIVWALQQIRGPDRLSQQQNAGDS